MAHVLVVDDIPDVADSFAGLLTLFGHDVRVAYRADDAMTCIQAWRA
jgi:DNA-binding NtrC family response regulator